VAHAKTSNTHRQTNTIRDRGLTMKPPTVSYEDRPDIMAPVLLAAFPAPSNQKPKTMLIRVEGKLTDESLISLYQTSRGYPAASFCIVDFSAVTHFAVSRGFIRKLANQRAAMADTDSHFFIVAPQPYVYGLCRMFQSLGEDKSPVLLIVHTLGEAFAAMGIEPPHFEPLAVPA
jgi:hypothetical protein